MSSRNISIRQIISFFLIVASGLFLMQIYLLKQSYELKKKEIIESVTHILSDLYNDSNDLLKDKKDLVITKEASLIQDFYKKKINITEFEKKLLKNKKNISDVLKKKMDSIETIYSYKIALVKKIYQIYIIKNNKKKALLRKELIVYANDSLTKEVYLLSKGNWHSETESVGEKIGNFENEINTDISFSLLNLNFLLFKKMISPAIISLFMILFSIYLFYLSIKSLKLQEQIANNHKSVITNVGHELKTPLATISMSLKTLKLLNNTTRSDEIIDLLLRQQQRLFMIVNQINFELDDIIQKEIQFMDLSQWSKDYLEDFKRINPFIKLKVYIKSNLFLRINELDWQIIHTNLLDNSIQYGASTIEYFLEEFKDEIQITIVDNGIGVTDLDSHYIFDQYYRAQKGNIYNTKGLGLGLFYVKNILDKYRATIILSNKKNPTIFIIKFPKK
ncbi:HAMP domain-containing sensor histidine kinase [Flavobacterium oreochromis]|uniref:sensor histidine kinase n=1 Tax=Flavobacterium oreochromis TaxID=2906078 RepID=UPI00385824BF